MGEGAEAIAEVVAYVGLIIKEQGEVPKACQLYQEAVLLAPCHASLCLNLIHTYTLRWDLLRALAFAKRYFSELATLGGRAARAARTLLAVLAGSEGKDVDHEAKFAVEH